MAKSGIDFAPIHFSDQILRLTKTHGVAVAASVS
jgi:hypothetical protein